MPFGNLNYERWQCEAGCAAVIILIFGKQQEIWEVELDWRDIFPVRRLSREPVWHEQNASRPPLGTGKQLCHSIAAQSDQTEMRPADRRHTEPNSRTQWRSKHTEARCPNPHCCSPSDSTLVATARGWKEPAFQKLLVNTKHDYYTTNTFLHFSRSSALHKHPEFKQVP